MTDPLSVQHDFNQLGVKDLLDARDLYHVHLMHKRNVVATAVGYYLIRDTDPWPSSTRPTEKDANKANGKAAKPTTKPPRTLWNSRVRPYSWPCILVLVNQWVDQSKFGRGGVANDDMVPPALYLPDGRVVPVCVVLAEPDETDPGPVADLTFPDALVGGGYPVLVNVQGEEHVASIGCMVTDGHHVYALTNRHVSGQPGEIIYTLLNGQRVQVGISSDRSLTRELFEEVYVGWPGKNVYVTQDIGLVKVLDKSKWTAQIYGIGTIGEAADLSVENISLRLIGSKVVAHGCASRGMNGMIHGLFYRYKSIAGFEYVADFLIGPRPQPEPHNGSASGKGAKGAVGVMSARDQSQPITEFSTRPGDSGTVWLLETGDPKCGYMPIAVQWGGHVFLEGNQSGRLKFALATCLSTVCNQLDVDIVRDWNLGAAEYWGAVGHYTIAGKAIDSLKAGKLKDWMTANRDLITYPTEQVVDKQMKGLSTRSFVPLADVPDMVWKVGPHKRGGMSSPEHSNHFADMDQPRPGDGKTLLDLCENDADTYVSVAQWQAYYTAVNDESRGLLPFRVWQIWDAMVAAAKAKDVASFVCAAGIVAHYVGDSCQPLHISYRFNGDPDRMVPDPKTGKQVPIGTGCHSAYEDGMVNFHIAEINAGLGATSSDRISLPAVTTGHEAAKAVVQLMQDTFADIQPLDIVNAFIKLQANGASARAVADGLWAQFAQATIKVMESGSEFLALIWQSAWNAGNGDACPNAGELTEDQMVKLYTDPQFLPSHTLDTIGPLLNGSSAGDVAGNPPASRGRARTRRTRNAAATPKPAAAGPRTRRKRSAS